MKKVIAIIRPERLSIVREVLKSKGVFLMTVTKVRGTGHEGSRPEVFRGQEFSEDMHPRIRLDIAVNDDFVDVTVDAIAQAARTGEVGDGKIFIEPLIDCIQIRTGERGSAGIGS